MERTRRGCVSREVENHLKNIEVDLSLSVRSLVSSIRVRKLKR